MMIGYARVSSTGQSLDVQQEALAGAGCDKVFAEKRTGTTVAGREALEAALEFARESDVFVVTRLDRLARSSLDLQAIVARLNAKGVGFRCLQQGAVDTTTPMGKLVLGMLAAIAEFETDLRKERQREGIDAAKAKGVYTGRPASIEGAAVRELHAQGVGPSEIARRLNIGRSSVYRAVREGAG